MHICQNLLNMDALNVIYNRVKVVGFRVQFSLIRFMKIVGNCHTFTMEFLTKIIIPSNSPLHGDTNIVCANIRPQPSVDMLWEGVSIIG